MCFFIIVQYDMYCTRVINMYVRFERNEKKLTYFRSIFDKSKTCNLVQITRHTPTTLRHFIEAHTCFYAIRRGIGAGDGVGDRFQTPGVPGDFSPRNLCTRTGFLRHRLRREIPNTGTRARRRWRNKGHETRTRGWWADERRAINTS